MMKRTLLDKSIDEINVLLQREYLKLSKKLIDKLMEMYAQIVIEGADALHSHLYSYNKYYEVLNKIQKELMALGSKENIIFNDCLTKLYQDNLEVIGEQFPAGTYINKAELETIIKRDWVGDGQNYSDRIWKDKRRLAETLQEELFEGVATGKSPEKMTKVLMERFSVSYSNAKRLAVTEMSHVYNESALRKYRQAGITKVKILGTNDERECEICKEYHKKIYPIDSCPMLPLHCNCRCVYTAAID